MHWLQQSCIGSTRLLTAMRPRLCESHKQSIGIQIASEPNGGPGCPHSPEARFGLPLCGHTKPSFVPPPPNAFMVGHVGQRPEDDGHWYEKAIPSLENPWP